MPEFVKDVQGVRRRYHTAEAVDERGFGHEARVPYCAFVGGVSGSRPNARKLDKSDLHSGPHVLQRHRCVDEHDGQWNERLGVERRFGWQRFGWRQFERRSWCRGTGDPQCPVRRRFPNGCLG